MRYLHTMLRVRNLDAALDFYCNKLGLKETRRRVDEKNRYTLVFLAGPDDDELVEDSKKTGPPGPRGRTHLQLGHRGLRRGALFRPPRLRGRRHLRHLRAADEGRRHHQPPAARRRHGLRALARQTFDRAAAEGRRQAAAGTLEIDAEYRQLVSTAARLPLAAKLFIRSAAPVRLRMRPSSRGPGHRPFTAVTRVRIP